jgi:hypothetical protein
MRPRVEEEKYRTRRDPRSPSRRPEEISIMECPQRYGGEGMGRCRLCRRHARPGGAGGPIGGPGEIVDHVVLLS